MLLLMPFPALRALKAANGFSLVELSIVLVILGLLTGGILAGQSLIRAAELRSVAADFQRYHAAVMSFRDKYMGLPGDMTTAYQFWGTAAGCTNTIVVAEGTGCNGNGDGAWKWWNSEGARGWQFMALSGLIEGSYTGVVVTSVGSVPGTNQPASKIGNAGYYLHYSATDMVTSLRRNAISIGAVISSANTDGPVLTPSEAWNIDSKLDDGLPERGMFRSFTASGATLCITGTSPDTVYSLTTASLQCMSRYFIE